MESNVLNLSFECLKISTQAYPISGNTETRINGTAEFQVGPNLQGKCFPVGRACTVRACLSIYCYMPCDWLVLVHLGKTTLLVMFCISKAKASIQNS